MAGIAPKRAAQQMRAIHDAVRGFYDTPSLDVSGGSSWSGDGKRSARAANVEVILSLARFGASGDSVEQLHSFFENLASIARPSHREQLSGGYYRYAWDHQKFILRDLFIHTIAALAKKNRFEAIGRLLSDDYLLARDDHSVYRTTFGAFDEYLRSLEDLRKRRLELRRISVQADLVEKLANPNLVTFDALLDAEVLCWARNVVLQAGAHSWYPRLLVLRDQHLPSALFVRATSRRSFDALKPALGVQTVEEFRDAVARDPRAATMSFNGWGVSLAALVDLDRLATGP